MYTENEIFSKVEKLVDKIHQNRELQQMAIDNGIDIKNSVKLTEASEDNYAISVIALMLAKDADDPKYRDLVRNGMAHRESRIDVINEYKDQANQLYRKYKARNFNEASTGSNEKESDDIIKYAKKIISKLVPDYDILEINIYVSDHSYSVAFIVDDKGTKKDCFDLIDDEVIKKEDYDSCVEKIVSYIRKSSAYKAGKVNKFSKKYKETNFNESTNRIKAKIDYYKRQAVSRLNMLIDQVEAGCDYPIFIEIWREVASGYNTYRGYHLYERLNTLKIYLKKAKHHTDVFTNENIKLFDNIIDNIKGFSKICDKCWAVFNAAGDKRLNENRSTIISNGKKLLDLINDLDGVNLANFESAEKFMDFSDIPKKDISGDIKISE